MFSRGNQEQKDESPIVDELSLNTEINEIGNLDTSDLLPTQLEQIEQLEEEQPLAVKLVERISAILSPYFIVIVGLYLSDDNFFFGGILIVIGILSLLKISYQDISKAINKIKNLLTQDSDNQ